MPPKKLLNPRFQKIRQQSLSERVRDILEGAILDKDFDLTERLPKETELSASFGVSRTVVREAIQNLKAEGLIESKVGSGNYVSEYSSDKIGRAFERFGKLHTDPEGLANYADLRMVVEVEAVARLAQNGDSETVETLRQIVAEMQDGHCSDEHYRELDLNFHLELTEASGNPLFCMILRPIQEHSLQLLQAKKESRENVLKLHQMNTEEHVQIIDAIEARDVDAAIRITRTHLSRAVEALRKKAKEGAPAAKRGI